MPDILYEDNHVIVAVKPPNMLSQADKTGDTDLLSVLKEYIRQVNEAGGVVSVDIQIRYDSTYDPAQLACLAEVNG